MEVKVESLQLLSFGTHRPKSEENPFEIGRKGTTTTLNHL